MHWMSPLFSMLNSGGFTSYPDFGSRSLPCLHLLFEVVDLLGQDLSVLQQITEVAPGLLHADHNLHFIEKPRLIIRKKVTELGQQNSHCLMWIPLGMFAYVQKYCYDFYSGKSVIMFSKC